MAQYYDFEIHSVSGTVKVPKLEKSIPRPLFTLLAPQMLLFAGGPNAGGPLSVFLACGLRQN